MEARHVASHELPKPTPMNGMAAGSRADPLSQGWKRSVPGSERSVVEPMSLFSGRVLGRADLLSKRSRGALGKSWDARRSRNGCLARAIFDAQPRTPPGTPRDVGSQTAAEVWLAFALEGVSARRPRGVHTSSTHPRALELANEHRQVSKASLGSRQPTRLARLSLPLGCVASKGS